jgi:hypothetical protein
MQGRAIWLTSALVMMLLGSPLLGGVASAATNVLVNGSFEWPSLNGATSRSFGAGEHVGAWQVGSGGVIVSGAIPPVETPPVGSQVMNLRPAPVPGLGDGEICQTVSELVPGAEYKIRFLAASVVDESTIDVTLDGNAVAHVVVPATLPAQFTLYQWKVIAATTSASLCLHGHPVGPGGVPLVDAVRMKPISVADAVRRRG